MNEEQREIFFDLLTRKVTQGLDDAEERQLAEIGGDTVEAELFSLEMAAAAIGISALDTAEPLPRHIRERILDDSRNVLEPAAQSASSVEIEREEAGASAGSWFGWLGWAAAAAAVVALAINIWFTRLQPAPEAARGPVEAPKALTLAELREEMLRSGVEMVRANWASPDPKAPPVEGDIVWSDAKQAGYMRFRGLPRNDPNTTCYQLWIFDKTQSKDTPIDGGVFDVTTDGEVVVPINAKLKAVQPEMFAVTVEKAGGVVVSKREKIAAIAKVAS